MAHGCYINVSECFIYKTLASTVIYVESFADFFCYFIAMEYLRILSSCD